MELERTPRQARAGIISGRVILVLIASTTGAAIALALVWFFFFSPK